MARKIHIYTTLPAGKTLCGNKHGGGIDKEYALRQWLNYGIDFLYSGFCRKCVDNLKKQHG